MDTSTPLFYDKPQEFGTFTRSDNAKLVFARIPTFEFQIQRFSLPGIALGTVGLKGRTGSFSRPGENLEFEKPLNLEIILDENYRALQEIWNWLSLIADPEIDPQRDFEKIVSDARIVILNNEKTEEVGTFNFAHCYPIALGSLAYANNDPNPGNLKFNASFDYSTYKPDFNKKTVCDI